MVIHQAEGRRFIAMIAARRGELAQAKQECEAALEVLAGTESNVGRLMVSRTLPAILVRLDDPGAPSAIADALERAHATSSIHNEGLARRANAMLLAAREDGAAGAEFDRAVDLLEKNGSRLELVRTLQERGSYLAARGELAAARRDLTSARDIAEECGAKPDQAKAAEALSALPAASASPRVP